jgi:hypothetical protein
MDIHDRDLGIIGAGAFLTVLCLLFKWPFVARIVVGLLILVVFMVVALWRTGPDKITIEEYLSRNFGKNLRPRKYSYRDQQSRQGNTAPQTTVFTQPISAPLTPSPTSDASPDPASTIEVPKYTPVAFAWEEVGIYRLVTVWLAVIGIYFIYWLSQGGTEQIGHWMKTLFKMP